MFLTLHDREKYSGIVNKFVDWFNENEQAGVVHVSTAVAAIHKFIGALMGVYPDQSFIGVPSDGRHRKCFRPPFASFQCNTNSDVVLRCACAQDISHMVCLVHQRSEGNVRLLRCTRYNKLNDCLSVPGTR